MPRKKPMPQESNSQMKRKVKRTVEHFPGPRAKREAARIKRDVARLDIVDQNIGMMLVPNPSREKRRDWSTRLGSQPMPELEVKGDKPGFREWTHRANRTDGPTPDLIYQPRRLRDDPLARLHDRGQISDTQFEAGRAWQALYEDSQGAGGLRSSGDIKEHVDGSPPTQGPITDKRQKATKRIIELDAVLGGFGKALVRDVLVSGMTTAQISEAHGMIASASTVKFLGRRFRECLDTLAGELGLA